MVDSFSRDSADLHVRMLGPPVVTTSDTPLTIHRRQARALLYYLAHDLQPAPRERLTFLFWPDVASSTARRNLTRLLSYLRQALPRDDVIETGGGTVALNTELVWSDCVAFEHMCAADRESAVAMYRGPFLDGFTPDYGPEYDHWLMDAGRHYERLYLQALSELINERREAGDTAAAIAYAQQYLATDELAEDVHRRLIELYADAGDRTAATRQFETCTLILERELGVPPLPATRAAYDAAREDTPSSLETAPAPEPTWRTLPSLDLPLVGRQDAWQQVAAAYRRLGEGGVIFISGEPGVGKSRLMQEFAEAQEALLLVGHSTSQPLPYGALVAALRFALAHPALGQGVRPIWLAETARVLPELHTRFPDLPPPVEVEPQQAQARLFEALTQVVLGLADESPLLLCLDDVHQADEATLGWLHYVTGRLAGSGVCILATYRTHEADPLRPWQRALERTGLGATVQLSGLSPAAVKTVLRQVDEEVVDLERLAGRVHASTGGNAFFVLEVVRELLETDGLTAADRDLPLPQTVQDTVLRRVGRLRPLARQVLEIAAVLAPHLELQTIVEASGRSEMEVVEGLEALASGQLLSPNAEHFRFHHDLAREAVYENIRPWRRRLLHRRAAGGLEKTRAYEREATWALVAEHYDNAGDATEAIRCYEHAARAAQQLYAHEEAAGYLRRAIERCANEARLARLHELLGDSLFARGQHEAAEGAYSTALDQVPPEESLLCASLQRKLAETFTARHLTTEAERAFDLALEEMGPFSDDWPKEVQQRWLEIQLSRMDLLYFLDDLDRMAELKATIESMVEAVGTAAHHVDFMAMLGAMAIRQEQYTLSAKTVDLFRATLAAARETEDLARVAYSQFSVGFALLWSGESKHAAPPLLAGLDLAEEVGVAYTQVLCLTYLTCTYRFLGDTAKARRYGERSLVATKQVDMPTYLAAAHANLAWLAWRDGLEEQARTRAEQALSIWGDYPYPFRWLASWVLLAIHTQREELAEADEAAQAILHPSQRRQPGDVPDVLQTAVAAWEADDDDTALSALVRAVELTEQHGYL